MNLKESQYSVTSELKILGFNLQEWPLEKPSKNEDWIKIGNTYFNRILLRKSYLKNLSKVKKLFFKELMNSLIKKDSLPIWEQFVFAFMKPEIFNEPDFERWQICTKIIRSSLLTRSQIYGASLALSKEGMLSASLYGLKRLIKEIDTKKEQRMKLITSIIEHHELNRNYHQASENMLSSKDLNFLIKLNKYFIDLIILISSEEKEQTKKIDDLIIFVDQEKNSQHGHLEFINKCKKRFKDLKNQDYFSESVIVEVGCSREIVAGQNSTNQLVRLSKEFNLKFIGIDIDKDVIEPLKRDFSDSEYNSTWIVGKGEEILKKIKHPIAAIYLDGYDFEHKMHSPFRQKIYIQEYGKKINDQTCHKVHLECVKEISDKIINGGLIGLDDTWKEKQSWAGKGKEGIIWLQKNGWIIIDESNRSCILEKRFLH